MSLSISVSGTGAVSPAGWGVPAMMAALAGSADLPTGILPRSIGGKTIITHVLRVPEDSCPAAKHPRLRRTSPGSKFAAAAVLEALGEQRLAASLAGDLRVGIIFTLTNGCVNYSNRFFGEVLADPAIASPILFPETVFNAPSSHLSAMIGSHSPNDTLVTDGAGFFTGVGLAVEWIERGDVDGCLVVASEEVDWLSAEGLLHHSRKYLPAEGAAAIYLEPSGDRESPDSPRHSRLLALPNPVSLSNHNRMQAARKVRKDLGAEPDPKSLLVDGCVGIPRIDLPETDAWADWIGPRLSPRKILGESMGAAAALQFVAAVESVKSLKCDRAFVVATGGNQQAAGAVIGFGG